MADKRISQLQQAFSPSLVDVFPIVHEKVTHKVALSTVYDQVSSISTNYVHTNFLPLTGGVISQNLTIIGNLSVDGEFTRIDTQIATTSAFVIDTSTSEPALRITQRGSGNVIQVEDSTNPDYTPLAVNQSGHLIIGALSAWSTAALQIISETTSESNAAVHIKRNSNDESPGALRLYKGRGTHSNPLNVLAEDQIGNIAFHPMLSGDTRISTQQRGANIRVFVDGDPVPSLSSVPTRFSFWTTNSGADTSTEKLRITNDGKAGIGTTAPNELLTVAGNVSAYNYYGDSSRLTTLSATSAIIVDTFSDTPALRVTQRGRGPAFVVEDSESQDITPFSIDNTGNVKIGSVATYQIEDGLSSDFSTLNILCSGSSVFPIDPGVGRTHGIHLGTFYNQLSSSIGIVFNGADDINVIRHGATILMGRDDFWHSDSINVNIHNPGNLQFWTRPLSGGQQKERMRIDSRGNVGIGTSTPLSAFHVEGGVKLNGSVSQGSQSNAIGNFSHAEGNNTLASGDFSHAEGQNTSAIGLASHAKGYQTSAIGNYSSASGYYAEAKHDRTWVWRGDSTTSKLSSTRNDQFMVSAAGGAAFFGNVGIGTDNKDRALTIVGDMSASGTAHVLYGSTISNTVTSVAVGGASPQSALDWKSKTVNQVLDLILFPDQLPTYTVPTIAIVGNQSGIKEIGENIAQNLTITSIKNDAGIFSIISAQRNSSNISTINNPLSQSHLSLADQYGYADPNNPNLKYIVDYTDNFTVVSGTTTWRGVGNYQSGLAKLNNKGVTDSRSFAIRTTSSPQLADSTFTSNDISINGIYPYFWGKSTTQPTPSTIASSIQANQTTKVLQAASGTVSTTFNASGEFVWIAVQENYTTKTKWYNTDLNRGDTGSGNFILSPVTQSVNSPDGRWSGVNYKIYISSYSTSTNGSIELRNT